MQGPDVGELLAALALENGDVVDKSLLVALPARLTQLQQWADKQR
jgi:hypothetical protein